MYFLVGNQEFPLSLAEALEISQTLLRATTDYPNCEFEIRFTEENGVTKWCVKAKSTLPDEPTER